MAHKKVSTITNNKIVKTLYDDIPSNENISLVSKYKPPSNPLDTYFCDICDYVTSKICNYNQHLSSKKHIEKVSDI
jgi:hypothetical protein